MRLVLPVSRILFVASVVAVFAKVGNLISRLLLGLLVLSGCSAPLKEVRDFGKASSSFATDGAKGYQLLKDAMADYELSAVAADSTKIATPDVFKGDKDIQSIRQSATRQAAVLANVAEYADALQKFAEADFKKDIDESATQLYDSLTGLQATYEKASGAKLNLSGGEIKILAAAVEGIGVLAADAKRKAAIKQIVMKTNPAIQQVSKLLAARFSGYIGPTIEQDLNTVETHMEEDFNNNWKDKSYSQRRERLEAIRKQNVFNQGIKPLFVELSRAAQKMGEAHQGLYEAVSSNKFTSVEFKEDVDALVQYVKSVKIFYEGLGKSTEKKAEM